MENGNSLVTLYTTLWYVYDAYEGWDQCWLWFQRVVNLRLWEFSQLEESSI